jgi:hypothetical protein
LQEAQVLSEYVEVDSEELRIPAMIIRYLHTSDEELTSIDR